MCLTGYNQYPLKLVEETRQHEVSQNISETTNTREERNDKDTITLNLPYRGNKDDKDNKNEEKCVSSFKERSGRC